MTQTIYVDILFAVNLCRNFFLLLVTARLAHQPYKRLRLLAGAALGALFSFVILLPELGILATKAVFSALIVLASFHAASFKRFLKLYACFFTVNFAFAGIAFALWLFVAPPGLAMGNGAFYFDISPLLLVVTAAAAYLLLSLFHRFFQKGAPPKSIYDLTVTVEGRSVTLRTLADTGNSLTESFTGSPVVLAEYQSVRELLPDPVRPAFQNASAACVRLPEAWQRRYRVIPYKSVGANGLLPSFKADEIVIHTKEEPVTVQGAFVAVADTNLSSGEYRGLMNPQLLPMK